MEEKDKLPVVLIDLPTFPKGVLSIGLSAVASALEPWAETHIIDFNLIPIVEIKKYCEILNNSIFIGIKVSSQNYNYAILITQCIKKMSTTPVIWGGELPTLLPDNALQYSDCIVLGPIEPVASNLVRDIKIKQLKKVYDGRGHFDMEKILPPDLRNHPGFDINALCMGVPIETSRGCDKKCTFCMVHVMQSKRNFKTANVLKAELEQYPEMFINIVDYNLGMNREHIFRILKVIEVSSVYGWMGEMCLETLDDDILLQALKSSRCRMIYCGLESIDQLSLRSINKGKTNQLYNYERIIRKIQSYGIQVAAGLILGLEGSNFDTYKQTFSQFENWGIAYTKLTFLTYNPGTKVKKSMRRKGTFITEDIEKYDGNHMTFVPHGVSIDETYKGAEYFIRNFYSWRSIQKRAKNAGLKGSRRKEFEYFNLYFRLVYFDWIKYSIFTNEEAFQKLLKYPHRKSNAVRRLEQKLTHIRRYNYFLDKLCDIY